MTSSASTNNFLTKAKSALKSTGANVDTLRNGIPDGISKGDVCILISPTGRQDYKMAQSLAESNAAKAVVIVNGLAKDQESVPGTATMAYYLKPLTYNSQVAGYLVRTYPQPWTALDAVTNQALGSCKSNALSKHISTPNATPSAVRSGGRGRPTPMRGM